MSNNNSNFKITLQAILSKIKSITTIKADIKTIESKLPKVKLQGTLLKTATQKEVNSKLKSIRPKIKVDADTTQTEKTIQKIGKQKNKTTITPTVDNTQVVSSLQKTQKEVKSSWNKFSDAVINNLIRISVQSVTQAIRDAISAVKELDTIKTNIQMVSGTSDSGVNAMMSSYNSMAKELSSTTKDVAEAANEFLRMGESIENTNELIKSSQVLSKVGMIQSSEAANYLISSLKGYQIAAEDSMDVVSKLTSVDLKAAVSAGGLAEALSKCSNIASNSGVSMDRLIGYTATVGETTQKSMSEVGNSFQALLSRMNNIKIGKFIDDETGESLSDTEAALNKLGIQLRDTENTYRSFDNVLDDVGSRWESFTKAEQNALSLAIAGTRQKEDFEALMNNWGNALKYSETAANSAGNALERYGVYQDSIEAKTNELTAAIESLSTNVISEELYSGIIKATTGLVEFLDQTNLLKSSLAVFVALGVSKTITAMATGFITAANSTKQLTAAMALFDKGKSETNLKAIGAACKGLSNNQLKLVLSTKGLEYADRKLILAGMGVAESEQAQMLAILGFANAENVATASTFSLSGALNALRVAFASNPIGFVLTAISTFATIIHIATSVESLFNQNLEETRQKASELFDEFKQMKDTLAEHKKTVAELADRYDELSKGVNLSNNKNNTLSTEEYEEFLDINKQLVSSFPELAHGIDKNGNSILTLGTKGITAKEQLEELLQTEEALNNFKIAENLDKVFEGVYTYAKDANKATSELNQSFNEFNTTINTLQNITENGIRLDKDNSFIFSGNTENKSELAYMQALVQSSVDFFNTLNNDRRMDFGGMQINPWDLFRIEQNDLGAFEVYSNIALLTPEEVTALEYIIKDNVSKIYYTLIDEFDAQKQAKQNAIQQAQNAWIDFIPSLIAGMKSKETFKKLDSDLQDIAVQIVEGLDYSYADAMNEYNPNDPYAYIRDKIIAPMSELSDSDKQLLKDNFTKLMKLDAEDITQSNQAEITKFINNIADLLKKDPLEIRVALGFGNADTIAAAIAHYKEVKNKAAEKFSGVTSQTYGNNPEDDLYYEQVLDDLDSFAKENSINTQDEIAFWNQCLEESNTRQEAMEKYLASPFAAQDSPTFNDIFALKNTEGNLNTLGQLNDQLNNIQTAYKNLTDAIDTYSSTGSITIDQFQAIVEQGADFLDYLTLEDGQLGVNEQAMYNLAEARIIEMKAQMLQGIVDNVSKIKEEGDEAGYLASTNYELKESYDALAMSKLYAWKADALANGLSQDTVDKVMHKAKEDIEKINALAANINLDSLGGNSASKTAQSFTDLLDKELAVLDKKMEAGYIDFNDYIQARLALIEDYYGQGKIKSDEYYSYLENHYKQELSYRDKVIKAVTRRIDREIDSLEKQKDAIKDSYQLQIDALENQKTLLEDVNKERQRQIDLQKALYELERAKNQRTKLVYSEGGGMYYVADDTAIRDAEKETENARYEIQISEIEKSISELEQARDAETDAIDDMIDKLQEYKETWNDITSAYEESQEDLLAEQMLGRDWEKDILDTRLDKLNQFKDDYIKIQQAMVDAAYQAAQAIENKEKVKIGDSSSDDDGDPEYKYEVVDESNPTSSKDSRTFNTKQEADAYARKMNKNTAASNGIDVSDDDGDDPKWMREFGNSNIPGYYVKKFHTGLKQGLVDKHSFDDDFKLVQKVGLGEKEIPAILKEGEAVTTPAQISNIADGLRTTDSSHSVQAERPYFMDEQERLAQCAALLGRSIDDMVSPMNLLPHNMKEITNMGSLNHVGTVNNIKQNQPNINVGGIHITCPGITSQEVARQVGTELNNMFNGFHLEAMQQSMMR